MALNDTNTLEMTTQTLEPRIRLVSVELAARVAEEGEIYRSPSDVARLLSQLIGAKDREHFVVLHLDAPHRVIAAEVVSIGSLTQALVHPREVFKGAILNNAQSIICGHNHPSGSVAPSVEDRKTCERLKQAGELLAIPLLDFVIVSGESYWSDVEGR